MLSELITNLQQSVSILQKREIQTAANALGSAEAKLAATGGVTVGVVDGKPAIAVGDDCAAIPDGKSYLLMAAEGMSPAFVEHDPWFAGWCAVMVNISDVAAMGGWPIAVVDALWSTSAESSQAVWEGMNAAARAYNVPIVGGHTNCSSPYPAIAAAILGRAEKLISSFTAKPGDVLLVVTDLRGSYYQEYPFWNAATEADPKQLRGDIALLPEIAREELCCAGKDISMGGLAGTLLMLMETSGCGAVLELDAIAKPQDISWEKWLTSFPSFGFLLAVPPGNVAAVTAKFQARNISCTSAGIVTSGSQIHFQHNDQHQKFWDLQSQPFTGFSPA